MYVLLSMTFTVTGDHAIHRHVITAPNAKATPQVERDKAIEDKITDPFAKHFYRLKAKFRQVVEGQSFKQPEAPLWQSKV